MGIFDPDEYEDCISSGRFSLERENQLLKDAMMAMAYTIQGLVTPSGFPNKRDAKALCKRYLEVAGEEQK
jgi:hypothetical protein